MCDLNSLFILIHSIFGEDGECLAFLLCDIIPYFYAALSHPFQSPILNDKLVQFIQLLFIWHVVVPDHPPVLLRIYFILSVLFKLWYKEQDHGRTQPMQNISNLWSTIPIPFSHVILPCDIPFCIRISFLFLTERSCICLY